MTISITDRIRKTMIGLTVALCSVFSGLIFLLVYVIEDQVFINQLKAEQSQFERVIERSSAEQIRNWRPQNRNISRVDTPSELAIVLPDVPLENVLSNIGIHEHFDEHHALFVTHIAGSDTRASTFLIYDVTNLLAVRDAKHDLFVMIGALTLTITGLSLLLARRLARSTLAPVARLSDALQNDAFDEAIIGFANDFQADEIGVLTRELARSLKRAQTAADREYQFNRGVSHELRSPMQVAQSATEVLRLIDQNHDGESARQLDRLQRAVTEMNEITESFMWLASDRQIKLEDRCPAATLQTMLMRLPMPNSETDLSVVNQASDDTRYPIPETVIAVVLRNLLRNAVSHGKDDNIKVVLDTNEIVISNPISTGDSYSQGYGVGLSVAARLCERFDAALVSGKTDDNWYRACVVFNPDRPAQNHSTF